MAAPESFPFQEDPPLEINKVEAAYDPESLPPPQESETAPALNVDEKELVTHAIDKEAVLPHVINAADKGEALEVPYYERRHEIKDDAISSAPESLGELIADMPKPQSLPQPTNINPARTTLNAPVDESLPNYSHSSTRPLSYRQAIRLGFLGGLGTILVMILYILLK